MKIVITGASGHLGANLVRGFISKNIHPTAMMFDDHRSLEKIDIEKVRGDVRDLDSLKRCFTGADLVFHLAAKISIIKSDEQLVRSINVDGTRNVVNACLTCGVRRLVNVASIHALRSEPALEPIDESRPLRAPQQGFPYDCSKADGVREVEIAMQKGLEVISVFPTGLIGPYDFKISPMGRFFLDLHQGKLPMLIDGGFNFLDIRDAAEGIISAAQLGKSGGRYLLSGQYVPIHHLAAMAAQVTGKKAPRLVFPIKVLQKLSPMIYSFAKMAGNKGLQNAVSPVALESLQSYRDIRSDKSQRELDFITRPLEETVQAIYSWFAEVGYL